jgi:3-hydroxybutyryl-CoA dehydrogenase
MDKDISQARLRIAVIGAGTMGCGIAAGFVAQGCDVVLLVREASAADAARAKTLALLGPAAAHDAAPPGQGPSRAAPVPQGQALGVHALQAFGAWDRLDLAIESIAEELEAKQQLFAWLDARVPADVPIGSNSSGFPISRIAAGLAGRARMFGMHYFMPAHLVPLVEVVLGSDSDPELATQVCAMFTAAGKKPVLVKRDIAGFLANRIQHALMREVLSLIDSGIASPEDIDLAVRYSFGFRYAAVGPVLQKEISGWESMARAAREIYPTLCNSTVLAPCMERKLSEGKLGMKSGEGFMTWTAQSAQATRADYEQRLAGALRLLQ